MVPVIGVEMTLQRWVMGVTAMELQYPLLRQLPRHMQNPSHLSPLQQPAYPITNQRSGHPKTQVLMLQPRLALLTCHTDEQ